MRLKEITPIVLRCGVGACPAIFETDRGTLIVIGKRIKVDGGLLEDKVSRDEAAVEIPKEFFPRRKKTTRK